MRITEGTVALGASHTIEASLVAHHEVNAWDNTGQVRQSEDVRITLSGAHAGTKLQQLAATGAGLPASAAVTAVGARAMAQPLAARSRTVVPGQLTAGLAAAPAPAATEPTHVTGSVTISATDRLWLLLLNVTGDAEGASRLAARLAALAQHMHAGSGTSQALQAVANAHPTAREHAEARAAAAAPPAPDWGYREDTSVTVTRSEETTFSAGAAVQTADGRQITLAAAFDLVSRSTATETSSIRAGAALHDPLVLNVTGGAPALGPGTQAVDVDNDGTAEQVAALGAGTQYLVRDLNGNGVVDGGAELFGPATNSGFSELAALDKDHSGWVDEGDAAFAQLGLWSGAGGAAIQSLADAGVGAIHAGSIATPFPYGPSTGSLAAAGVFLYEDGRTGIAGEVNLLA
jgi:hypothetical protein